ncbi:MAG: DUF2125 domain-containing protein [Pseudomonadota bacterium]
MSFRVRILAVIVAIVVVGWSGFWWFAASTVDKASAGAIDRARSEGVDVACGNRAVSGWPFRLTLTCNRIGVASEGIDLSADALRAVALVYNPSHLIIEADSPFRLAGSSPKDSADADWRTGRASVQLNQNRVDRASLSFSDLKVSAAGLAPFSRPGADRLEIHARRADEPSDLDVALESRGVRADLAGETLPSFDLDVLATVIGGAPLLSGAVDSIQAALEGGNASVAIQRALLTLGEAQVEAIGTLKLAPDGYLNGEIRVAVAGAEALGRELNGVGGLNLDAVRPLLTVLQSFGEPTDIETRPANAVTVLIRDGYATAGLLPLGRIDPVRFR